MILLSAFLIAYNEGMAVKGRQAVKAGVSSAAPASAGMVFPVNEGKLLYVTGAMAGAGPAVDREFGLTVEPAVCLLRKVEIRQWVEKATKEKDAQGYEEKVYSYEAKWSEEWIDSSRFAKDGHQNPENKPFPTAAFVSPSAALGAFKISPELCALYSSFKPLELTEEDFKNIPLNNRSSLTLWEGAIYNTRNPAHPGIGHARITFFMAAPQDVTIVGKQENGALTAARLPSGKPFGAFVDGTEPLNKAFAPPSGWGIALTLFLRLTGLFAMAAGIMLTLGPLELIISFFPKIHGLLEKRPFRAALLGSGGVCLWIMAPQWYGFQPIATGFMAIAGGGCLFLLVRDIQRAEPKPEPPSPVKGGRLIRDEAIHAEAGGVIQPYTPRKKRASSADSPEPGESARQASYTLPSRAQEGYKPKRLPGVDGPGAAGVIEQAYVFHELGRMDKSKAAEMIRKREAGPDGMAPKVWGVTGIHVSPWPEEERALEAMIRQGMAAHARKHPELGRYQDKSAYEVKVWIGQNEWLGRFAAAMAAPKKRA